MKTDLRMKRCGHSERGLHCGKTPTDHRINQPIYTNYPDGTVIKLTPHGFVLTAGA